MYNPQPADTKDIELDSELVELTEKIARNVHDVWARGRIEDGWKYGPVRDDVKKETPCLVPYEMLSEQEKEFDRRTAMESLKLVIKFGYKIEKE